MTKNPHTVRVFLGRSLYNWLENKGGPLPLKIRQIVQKEHNREKAGALNTPENIAVPVVAIDAERAQITLYIGEEIGQGLKVPAGNYVLYLGRGPL